MAISVIRYFHKFNSYFTKKKAKRQKIVIANVNKLLQTIFALLKHKTKFDDNLVYPISN